MRSKLWIAIVALAITPAAAQTPVERGKYLVEGILTCGNCHTPRGPGGVLDTSKRHAGGPQVWETPQYKVHPTNITPDRQTGIGAMKDPIKRGFYLVTLGHCMECHTPVVDGHRDFKNRLGTGGERFPGPWGMSVSRNITQHREHGIGAWTDEEIKRAITRGVSKDGRKLLPP